MQYMRARIISFVFAISWCGPVWAHDFWIEPDRYVLPEPGGISLTLREGVSLKGNAIPYLPRLFEDFSRTDSTGTAPIISVIGDNPAATIEPRPGQTLIGYQSVRNLADLDPETFANYLREEGLERVFGLREERGEADENAKEYFIRCAKSLVTVESGFVQWLSDSLRSLFGNQDVEEEIWQARLGYILELMPEANPYGLDAGAELPLQLLHNGEPVADILVIAIPEQDPADQVSARTDADGRVTLTLARPGPWLIKAVHLIPLYDDPDARWESYWASLTFEL